MDRHGGVRNGGVEGLGVRRETKDRHVDLRCVKGRTAKRSH
jgi:hypothetical protein